MAKNKKSKLNAPVQEGQKRNNKAILIRLWGYLKNHKIKLVIAITLSVLANIFSLLGPLFAGLAVDSMVGKGQVDFDRVILYASLMTGLYIASAVTSFSLSKLMISISQNVVVALRRDVFNRITDLPVSYFDNVQTGDILSRITYDIDTIASSLSSDCIQIFGSVIIVVGSFVLMLIIAPILVLVFVFTIPISVLATIYLTKKVRPLFRARSQRLGEMNGYAEEIITGHKTIKAYRAEESIIQEFEQKNKNSADAYFKGDYYGTMAGPAMNFVNNISIVFISLFGVLLYLYKFITIGNIASFTLYARKFAGPINEFANILSELQSALSAAERVFKIVDAKKEKDDSVGATDLVDILGNVKMKDINFCYQENKPILKDINFMAQKGKTVAIVGPTGCGKTTIISLLMRFYDPQSGTITIDDKDVFDLTRKSVRKAYSMVLQDTWLFGGTIFDNIAYAKSDATIQQVQEAARAAHIDGYISALPKGYDTIIDEEGLNISKGQKQLITIARAMLADSNMLILDEATSNVDTRTELSIRSAMLNLMKNKTCFVIAHRLSTIINADLILVMNDGRIIEKGKHQQLLADKGYYYQLFHAQFE